MVYSKKSGGSAAEADNEIDAQIQHWNGVKNHRKLKSRIRKGIPQQLRGTVWQNLSGARQRRKIECARYGSKNLYSDLRARKRFSQKTHDQIWKDINRTYRKHVAHGATAVASAHSNLKEAHNDSHNNSNSSHSSNSHHLSSEKANQKGTSKFFKIKM